MSLDFEMNVDAIDWLVAKCLSLVWRSKTDPAVFESRDSGYDLFGFQDRPFTSSFDYEPCIVTSVEDLYRPLSYEETHQLRHARPGLNLGFLRRQFVPDNHDRSRIRLDEIRFRNLGQKRSDLHHRQQYGRHAGYGVHRKEITPEILARNGFEVVPVENGFDGNFQLIHHLGKENRFFDILFSFLFRC